MLRLRNRIFGGFCGKAVLKNLISPLFLVIIAYFIMQLLTFRTGIGSEDFRDILSFKLVNAGSVPYRDFYWYYGPLGVYLGAFFIKFLGSELILMRLAVVFIGAIGLTVVYCLAKKIMSNNFSLLAAFCSFTLFTFPNYSFNHYLSVLSLVVTLWYVMRFFSDLKLIDLFMWDVFLTLTFLIRPAPTGIVLACVSLLVIILFSMRRGLRILLRNIFFLFSFFLFAITAVYFLTGGLFLKAIFMLFTLTNPAGLIFRFPNTLKLIQDFYASFNIHALKDIAVFYNLPTFINMLSSHIIYWFILISIGIFSILSLYAKVSRRTPKDISPVNYLAAFLCLLSFLLLIYFHNCVLMTSYPDLSGGGKLYLWTGQYLLQPGIIFFFYVLYRFKVRTSRVFLTTVIYCVLVSAVVLPKISDLKYMVMKMPIGRLKGVKGIYLNNAYEKFFIPVIEYIREKEGISEYLFVPSYFPGFYALTDKKPLVPEDLQALFYDFSSSVNGKSHFYSCHSGFNAADKAGADNIILNRLIKFSPCVVLMNTDLSKFHTPWEVFIRRNYHLEKRFTYRKIIASNNFTDNPVIDIYLPNIRR